MDLCTLTHYVNGADAAVMAVVVSPPFSKSQTYDKESNKRLRSSGNEISPEGSLSGS
jgi:hypothetical protein